MNKQYTNYIEILEYQALTFPEKIAYTFLEDGEENEAHLTYSDLLKESKKIAGFLQTHNLTSQPVLMLYPQGMEFIKAFWGCIFAGTIAIPSFPPRANRTFERWKAILEDAGAKIVFTQKGAINHKFNEQLIQETYKVVFTEEISIDYLFKWKIPFVKQDDIAFLQYTSGSTGSPKGVMVTHNNLIENQRIIAKAFHQNEESIILGWLPFYHDMGLVGKVLHPVFIGATAILMSPVHFLQKPVRWLKAIDKYKATTSGAPNFAYDLCVERISDTEAKSLDLSTWKVAFCGAEPIKPETLKKFSEKFSISGFTKHAFQPCYGMAETTLLISSSNYGSLPIIRDFLLASLQYKSGHTFENSDTKISLVSCGNPTLFGYEIKIINNLGIEAGEEQVGEIWVSGKSVAKGYWGNKDTTEEIFRAQTVDNTSYFLKTGDLGLISDGQLYITGRLKDLLIINGRNYYPQDLEYLISSSSDCLIENSCAVFSVPLPKGEGVVVVTEVENLDEKDKHTILLKIRQAIFFEYELDLHDVILVRKGTIPKTTSGKIQRQICRKSYIDDELAEVYKQSQNNTISIARAEKVDQDNEVINTIKEIGEIKELNPQDNLFTLGFNSIKIAQLAMELSDKLAREISLDLFFESKNIQELLDELQKPLTRDESKIIPTSDIQSYPLSSFQKGIWIDMILNPESTAYNLPVCIKIGDNVNLSSLQKAFSSIIEKNTIYRTYFVHNKDQAEQKITNSPYNLEIKSINTYERKDFEQYVSHVAKQTFDISSYPLFHGEVILFNGEFYFLWVIHHLISDGFSLHLFIKELLERYYEDNEIFNNTKQVVQYYDFVSWQNQQSSTPTFSISKEYWSDKLAGYIPIELPFDHSSSRINRKAKTFTASIPSPLASRLREVSTSHQTTLYGTLLTGLFLLLRRLSGSDDITVCCPMTVREASGLGNAHGLFVNTVLLRTEISGNDSIKESIQKIHSALTQALKHKAYPLSAIFEDLEIKSEEGKFPISQVAFNLLNFIDPIKNEKVFDIFHGNTTIDLNFDLNFYLVETPEEVEIRLDYRESIFKEDTISTILTRYVKILSKITTSLSLEVDKLELENNTTKIIPKADPDWYTPQKSLEDVLKIQFTKFKEKIAISTSHNNTSYNEVDVISNKWAHYFYQRKETLICLYLPPSQEAVIALIGVLKAGKTAIFLDLSYPKVRIEQILEDINPALVITREVDLDNAKQIFENKVHLVSLSELEDFDRDFEEATFYLPVSPEATAYILYTSGSTGRPKGVIQTRRNLLHFAAVYAEEAKINSEDKITGFSSYSFDSSFNEIFGALLNGATYFPKDVKDLNNTSEMYNWLADNKITIWQSVPTLFRYYANQWKSEGTILSGLKMIKMTGEPVRNLDFELFKSITCTPTKFMVSLGSTECSLFLANIFTHDDSITKSLLPVGFPLIRTNVFVGNSNQVALGSLEKGEIIVQSNFITPGYLNLESDNFFLRDGLRYFKTGDIGRKLTDGRIEWLTRKDTLVKRRGVRIELAEIENKILSNPGIKEAIAWIHAIEEEDVLVVYIISPDKVDIKIVREDLLRILPDSMMPDYILQIDSFPKTRSGKIDRKNLPLPDINSPQASNEPFLPLNKKEEVLSSLWKKVLKVNNVGASDHFFEKGGNSIKAMQLIALINKELNTTLSFKHVFENATLRKLSNVIDNSVDINIGKICKSEIKPYYDLTNAQLRIWLMSQLIPYNISSAFHITGELNIEALKNALFSLVERHESLRTIFIEVDEGIKQKVLDVSNIQVQIPFGDISNIPNKEEIVLERLKENTYLKFDLNNYPLINVTILKTGNSSFVLFLTIHHIISDGWSMEIFSKELITLYADNLKNRKLSMPVLEVQFKDYAQWYNEFLRSDLLQKSRNYWMEIFKEGFPSLMLKTDFPRPGNKTYDGRFFHFDLGCEMSTEVLALLKAKDCTLYVFLLSILNIWLSQETNQKEIVIGTLVAGRDQLEIQDQIGMYALTLPIKSKIDPDATFDQFLSFVNHAFLNGIENQLYPIDRLAEDLKIKRDPGRSMFFDVLLILHNTGEIFRELSESSNLKIEKLTNTYSISKVDLTFNVYKNQELISFEIEYDTHLYESDSIELFSEKLKRIITKVCANYNIKLVDLMRNNLKLNSVSEIEFNF